MPPEFPTSPHGSPSWQSHVVSWLVRARMRPHVHRPIDAAWIRRQMGRPRAPRRWMVRATGAQMTPLPPTGAWPGGEVVTARVRDAANRVVLYLHGGGYIACSPETHRPLVAALVSRIGGTAYVPTYGLAPEHPYPAALHDAQGAYRHLVDACGITPSRLIVAGDSAGGGLALALVLSLREAGMPLPAAVVTFSPWTDMAATGASLDENSQRCAMFAGDTIRRAARFYSANADPFSPTLSPLYGDYHGFPPLLVHASADETLRDDAVRVAERARAHGASVTCRLWAGVPHVWQFFSGVMPEAAESLQETAAFIRAQT